MERTMREMSYARVCCPLLPTGLRCCPWFPAVLHGFLLLRALVAVSTLLTAGPWHVIAGLYSVFEAISPPSRALAASFIS